MFGKNLEGESLCCFCGAHVETQKNSMCFSVCVSSGVLAGIVVLVAGGLGWCMNSLLKNDL